MQICKHVKSVEGKFYHQIKLIHLRRTTGGKEDCLKLSKSW